MTSDNETPTPEPRRLTPHALIRTVQAVVNPASGSVGAGAAAQLAQITESFGLEAVVHELSPGTLVKQISEAVAAKPDLLIVLAGDGTARLAADKCGPDGPLVAPLPGGTMNMLPKALYGERNWQDALTATLETGEVRPVSGGEISGMSFYVAAILGAPALWADAREAVRELKFWVAVQRARLEKLQDILGCINDAVTLESLFASARSRARRWPVAAADAVMLQHRQLAVQQRRRLASAWRRYRAATQPWTTSQGS